MAANLAIQSLKAITGVAVVGGGLFGSNYGYQFYTFHNDFKKLEAHLLKGRSLVDKLNITYMHATDKHQKLTAKLAHEHNQAFDEFVASGIWDTWYNTPLAARALADDYFWLSTPAHCRGEGARQHCVGDKCDVMHEDLDNPNAQLSDEAKRNFLRGEAVGNMLVSLGVEKQQQYDRARLEAILPTVDKMLTSKTATDSDKEKLQDVKVYIQQIQKLDNIRQADYHSRVLSADMQVEQPVLYWMVKKFHGLS